jgi:hypothetical protein
MTPGPIIQIKKHENHAHGERVEDQRVHDSDAWLIGSVVRKQLVHLILAPLMPNSGRKSDARRAISKHTITPTKTTRVR